MATTDLQDLLSHLESNKAIGLFCLDRSMAITAWNPYMEFLTGYAKEDCLGLCITEIIEKFDTQEIERLKKVLAGESLTVQEKPLLIHKRTGQVRYCDFFYKPLVSAEGTIEEAMVLVSQDVGQEKRSYEQVKRTLRTITSFLRFAPMPVFIIDRDYRVQLANDAFNFYLNNPNSLGCKIDELVSPDTAQSIKDQTAEVLRTGVALHSGEAFDRDGHTYYFYIIKFPIRNQQGEIEAVGGYGIDITDKVKQEERIRQLLEDSRALNKQLEHQNEELEKSRKAIDQAYVLLQGQKKELEKTLEELSERNYELDQIMYKTSHDLRAPLSSILGLLMLAQDESDPKQLSEYHAHIRSRIEKLDGFVKSMLSYARNSRTAVNLQPVNWHKLISDAYSNLEYLQNYNKIEKRLECNCQQTFYSDLFRLSIIFNNLIGNAIKYADLKKENPYLQVRIETMSQHAFIEISDNGIGIEEKYLDKIGGMFFRATNSAEGSGLGMYIVLQTLEKLDGKLEIESSAGKGTCIRLILPAFGQQVPDRGTEKLQLKKPVATASGSEKKD
jgi:PAS domain S-box-containing protein